MATHSQTAKEARLKVLDMVFKAQSSHIGSNFSIIDVLAVLFDKADLNKDKIILSAGWKAASFYYFLSEKDLIPKEELDTYNQEGSRLIGLTEPGVPGVHFAGGSMGLGFPASVGFALSKKMKGEDGSVYCIMSDGELNSGTTWESALLATQHKLDNLIVFVDSNKLQAMGKTDSILKTPFPQDGWSVHQIDGHDYEMIDRAIYGGVKNTSPTCFIANTVKGKGWKRAENNNLYHYKNLSSEEYEEAKKEINDR